MSAPATMKQAKQVMSLFGTNPSSEAVQQFLSAGDLVKAMLAVGDLSHVDRKAFKVLIAKPVPELPAPNISEPYRLTIDYSQSLEQMVTAGGYNYVNPDITEANFPVEKCEAELEALLLHFDRDTESDEVLKFTAVLGFRAGTMPELNAFGAQYPDIQRQFPIVALGSVWARSGGRRNVGCLHGNPDLRHLSLHWFEDRWNPFCRFLVFRKPQ